jgi:hypothetical protein
MTETPYGRGVCAACGRPFNLTKAGDVRHHLLAKRPSNWYRSPVCAGAGRPPQAAK